MYDQVTGTTDTAEVARDYFTGFFREKFMALTEDGELARMPMYYDPEIDYRHGHVAGLGLGVGWYVLPYLPDIAKHLFQIVAKEWGLHEGLEGIRARSALHVAVVLASLCVGGCLLLQHFLGTARCLTAAVVLCCSLLGLAQGLAPWLSPKAIVHLLSYRGIGRSLVTPLLWPSPPKLIALCLACACALGGLGAAASPQAALGAALLLGALAWASKACADVVGCLATVQINQVMLALAVQLGASDVESSMRDLLEPTCEPRSFGDGSFGFFYHLGEEWPRGQLSALRVAAEIGRPGAWERAFNNPHYRDRFSAPSVEGVDFPVLGLCRAWNDAQSGTLAIGTYAATPSKTGEATKFRIVHLPAKSETLAVTCDGAAFSDWTWLSDSSIEVRTTVAEHAFVVETGFKGGSGV